MPTISPEKVHAAAQRGIAKRQETSRRAAMSALTAAARHTCEWEEYGQVAGPDGLPDDIEVFVCGEPARLVIVEGYFGPIAVAACPQHFTTV